MPEFVAPRRFKRAEGKYHLFEQQLRVAATVYSDILSGDEDVMTLMRKGTVFFTNYA